MKIRNLFLILLAQTLGWTGISAQSIDAEDAAARARDFFQRQQSTTVGVHKAQAMVKPVLAYTATTANTPDFYVFNRAEDLPGFVIVNADATSTTEILGYSEMSTFDYDTAPDNFKWWLQQYQTNGVSKAPAKAAGIRHDVDYLCKTKWNQDEPYWKAINQAVGNYGFVTGCAATSMAQVMKYYNYPERGKGSYEYTIKYNSGALKFSADFANTTYDWANMLDDYSKGYTQQQANAVATLMYHCGVAQDMSYNRNSNGGSSANTGQNGKGMINHFKYDRSMMYATRLYYTDEAWDELMYGEVSNNRPVIYDGQSTGGGHSFICDGYRCSDQTYHFNWGWGGYCDGNYALTGKGALAPNGSGIGGSTTSDGYTGAQGALVNIKKDEGGTYVVALGAKAEMSLWESGGQEVNYITNCNLDLRNENKTLYYQYTPYNSSLLDLPVVAGIELRHKVTGERLYSVGARVNGELPVGHSYVDPWTMSFETNSVPLCNGVYELRPAFMVDEKWYTGCYGAYYTIPTLTVTGGEDPVDVDVPLTISSSQVMVGKSVSISHGDYYAGHITYESDAPEIASVSADGVVTGEALGSATITARAEATKGFNATVRTFRVEVVSRIYHDVVVTLDKKKLQVGETANISITSSYDGETSYTVVPEGIVSVSADGVVTALAEGDAVITVNVAGNDDFLPATKKFEVTVSNPPPAPAEPGFCMDSYPWVGKDNIATSSDFTLHIPLYNNSESEIDPANFYVRMFCYGGYVTWTCGFYSPYASHSQYEYKINPIEYGYDQYFTPGNVYTYEFYLDEDCTKPMNVRSLTYYYSPDNPTVGTAAQLVDGAKNGNGATSNLVKSLVSKILQK